MEIEAKIDYWGESFATFDPEKVAVRLIKTFPKVKVDFVDLSRDEVARFIYYAENHKIAEPIRIRMEEQLNQKAARNGPIYKFKLEFPPNTVITGYIKRYRVSFKSEQELNEDIENQVVQFLESLKLGKITSDRPTKLFCRFSPDVPQEWLLESA
jgi:hypothetical protein